MPIARPTLILTRPEAASLRFAGQFRAAMGADWPVIIAPLMRTVWREEPVELAGVRGIIFTSETAVHALARLTARRDLTAWCVGPRTADVARTAGYDARVGPGDAAGLAQMILDQRAAGPLCWPHGRDIAFDLAATLNQAGTETVSVTAYHQEALPLCADALSELASDRPVLVALFSPRSVELFARALPSAHAPLWVAAISPAVAQAAGALNPARLGVAARPDSESLLAAMYKLAHDQRDG